MKNLATIVVGLALLLVESALLEVLGLTQVSFQTSIILAVYLGTRRDFVDGGLTLAALLVPIEWLASGPGGFHMLGVSAVFFVSQVARASIQGVWGFAHVLLAVLATALHMLVMAVAMLLLMPDTVILTSMAWSSGLALLGVAVAAWPVGALLSKVDAALDPGSQTGRLEMG
ncbi:MAG: hypothetical protein ACQEVA_01340 [Myxococcota bacterium]